MQKYDVRQQTHLPFQGFEDHFSPGAKRILEAKLQAALEEEDGDRRGGAAKGGVDAMDTDGGNAYPKNRGGPGRPTRSTSAAAAAAAGSKRDAEDAARKDSAAGYRKVYKLADYKGYQEMKEQVRAGRDVPRVRAAGQWRVTCGRPACVVEILRPVWVVDAAVDLVLFSFFSFFLRVSLRYVPLSLPLSSPPRTRAPYVSLLHTRVLELQQYNPSWRQ